MTRPPKRDWREVMIEEAVAKIMTEVTPETIWHLLYVGSKVHSQGIGLVWDQSQELVKQFYDARNNSVDTPEPL